LDGWFINEHILELAAERRNHFVPGTDLPQKQQRGQGGAAGDEDRGEMRVVDRKLLSGKAKTPASRGLRGDDLQAADQTKAMALSYSYNTK